MISHHSNYEPAAPPETTYRVEALKNLLVNDNGFAFDPRAGLTYTISPTGRQVIDGLKAGRSSQQIALDLAEQFDVDPQTVAEDCEQFLHSLESHRLIEIESQS